MVWEHSGRLQNYPRRHPKLLPERSYKNPSNVEDYKNKIGGFDGLVGVQDVFWSVFGRLWTLFSSIGTSFCAVCGVFFRASEPTSRVTLSIALSVGLCFGGVVLFVVFVLSERVASTESS